MPIFTNYFNPSSTGTDSLMTTATSEWITMNNAYQGAFNMNIEVGVTEEVLEEKKPDKNVEEMFLSQFNNNKEI